jgi:hypothetical protein
MPCLPTFRENVLPPSSGLKTKPSNNRQQVETCLAYSWTLKIEALLSSESLQIYAIIEAYHCHWLRTKFYPNIFPSRLSLYTWPKLLAIIRVDFWRDRSVNDQVFCIRQILEKEWKYKETVHQLFTAFKKAYYSFRRKYCTIFS